MGKVKYERIQNSSNINDIPIEDGQIIYTKDGKTYLDYDNDRIVINGTPDSEMSDISTNAIANNTVKDYIDTNDLKKIDKYNLVTNSSPIKTGRKINGNDEYVKSFKIVGLDATGTIETVLGITSPHQILRIEGTYLSTDGRTYPIGLGEHEGSSSTFTLGLYASIPNNRIYINNSSSYWIEAYIEIYFI